MSELMKKINEKQFLIGLIGIIILSFSFYLFTVSRWIGLGDTALLIDQMVNLTLNSHVNNHNLVIIFGYIFNNILPFDEIAFKCNLVSVFFGSLSIILFYILINEVLKKPFFAFLSSLILIVTHSMWWHSTIVENYSINAFFLIFTILMLYKDTKNKHSIYFYIACVLSGIVIFNHVQMGFLAPVLFVYAIFYRNKDKHGLIVKWLKMGAFYNIGLTPYLIILFKDIYYGDSEKALYWAIGGDFTGIMLDFKSFKTFRSLAIEFFIQFPSPMLLFVVLGVYFIIIKRLNFKLNISIFVGYLVNTIFFMQYNTWDKFAFLLPSFIIMAYWGAIGIYSIYNFIEEEFKSKLKENVDWVKGAVIGLVIISVLFPPYFYYKLPQWGATKGFWYNRFNNNYTANSHDCASYIANPDKRYFNDVDYFANLLFEKLPESSIFIDDDSRTYYPLDYYFKRYYKKNSTINFKIMNTWGFSNWGDTEEQLYNEIHTYIKSKNFFVISTMAPFKGLIRKLSKKGIIAEKYNLDKEHWIYKFNIIDKKKYKESVEQLKISDIMVGIDFNGDSNIIKTKFNQDEKIMVKIDFQKNTNSIPIQFKWIDPTGNTYFLSETFWIPEDNTGVWSILEGEKEREKGNWKVIAISFDEELKETSFIIE